MENVLHTQDEWVAIYEKMAAVQLMSRHGFRGEEENTLYTLDEAMERITKCTHRFGVAA